MEGKKFYGVYYYRCSFHFSTTVNVAGFYETPEEAIKRLKIIIPNYKKGVNNTVSGQKTVGWINEYLIGDINSLVICGQPSTAINVFPE